MVKSISFTKILTVMKMISHCCLYFIFMCNNLETMKNKHEMSGKGKTVVFPVIMNLGASNYP